MQGLVGDYNRYNAEFNISGQYNGTSYSSTALVDVDVLAPVDPTIPPEIGDLDVIKTKNFGGLSWSWKNVSGKLVPFVTGTIVTKYGIISFWDGDYCFTQIDTNTITDRLSNSIKSEGPEYLIPAYIRILNDPNKHWGYQDINGQYRDEINGVDIEMLENVSIDKPFIAEGGNATVYQINGNHVKIVYNGKVIFDEVFPVTK